MNNYLKLLELSVKIDERKRRIKEICNFLMNVSFDPDNEAHWDLRRELGRLSRVGVQLDYTYR